MFTCALTLSLPGSLYATDAGASFLNIGVGSRSVGMGGAYSAIGNDIAVMHWNPAGLVNAVRSEEPGARSKGIFSAMHNQWIADMSYDFMGYARQLGARSQERGGVIGASIVMLSQGNMEGRDENRQVTQEFGANDAAMTLSFASTSKVPGARSQGVNLSYGINLKIIRQQIESAQAIGLAMDMGLLYRFSALPFSAAFSVQNLGPQMKFLSEGYDLPLSVTLGAGYVISGLTLALDIKQRIYEGKTSISIGTEYLLSQSFALRTGYLLAAARSRDSAPAVTNGVTNSQGLGGGFGVKLFGAGIDYSFTPFGDLGITHNMTFNFEF